MAPAALSRTTSPTLGAELARELVLACPPTDPSDDAARQSCGGRLASLPILRDIMEPIFRWGGQKEVGDYDLDDSQLTRFEPYVWRRMYLAMFMFTGDHRVEEVDGKTVIHVSASFRNALDGGAYPYPFWHSEKKWRSYQTATELLFIVENGRMQGAMRSAESDTTRAQLARKWDGLWAWNDGAEPRVTLFRSLFSAANPRVAELDRAYRELEEGMRPYNCATCHAPNNPSGMNPLALLVYPNQALAERHEIVRRLEENDMPPETATTPAGIADPESRQRLLKLARGFADAADRALDAEGARRADR